MKDIKPAIRFILWMILLPITLLSAQSAENDYSKTRTEAFEYLNLVRTDPPAHASEIGINLDGIAPRPVLIWNEALARSAQRKAEDLARRDYLGHFSPEGIGPVQLAEEEGYIFPLTWPDSDVNNYIESISAGSSTSGREHIKNLLYDGGMPHNSTEANHRRHLLGMNDFWAAHVDVGIGYASNPDSVFGGYLVVHTGVPGDPFHTVTGMLRVRNSRRRDLGEVWVGAIAEDGQKYWTTVALSPGQHEAVFELRVPRNTRIIMRYFKELSDGDYLRGFYADGETVPSQSRAEWLDSNTNEVILLTVGD